jgi:aminoglycoside phosphotransferase family enzyme/predicted kinase
MALPDRLTGLLDEGAYSHPCPTIELIETHISWVILTGEFAYKLKKPVKFNFVDFSTLELREHFCREEVRCNRAFAPDLYLGVVRVIETATGVAIEADPDESTIAVEWAVKMRQFDPELGLDRILARGELTATMLSGFGATLAARHAALPRLDAGASEVPRRIFGPVEDNFSEIANTDLAPIHGAMLRETLSLARTLGDRLRRRFDDRITQGNVRECHGDLHLSNLALVEETVTAFDCLEFNENLRWIDTMSDVAFLFMDCHVRGELECAYAFLDGYLDASADYSGVVLLPYFSAYRSVVRAKVAALRWAQDGGAASEAKFLEHLRWANVWLKRPPGLLVLTCGLSGSGKSHLAGRLVGLLPAIRLRSDVARKSLAGLDVLADSDSPVAGGLYSEEFSRRTFDHLAEVAEELLSAGENVIIDATFIERPLRERFARLGETLGAATIILYCDAPEAVLRARLESRTSDASEATAAVLDLQLTRFEPPGADEAVIRVDTGKPLTDPVVDDLVRELASL